MTLKKLDQYGFSFQIKVISALITHKNFLINIHDIISPKYFSNQAHQWIIEEILKYHQKYNTTPTLEVLKGEMQKVDNEVLQVSIKDQLKKAYVSSDEDLEYVQDEFTNFCKNQQLKKALMSSVDLLKAGDFDGIRFLIDNALKAGQDKNIGHDYKKDIEDRYREESRKVIPTPWPVINDLLQGGLGNGDFGIVFGNPGGGKSWTMVSLAGYAAKLGYNVVYYTLELGDSYVGKRLDAYFTGIDVSNISKSENREKIEDTIKNLQGQVIVKEYPTGRASISTIESHINKCNDLGIDIDMIIIDYVDLLKPLRRGKDRKDDIDDIYISTKGLAKQLDIPIWSVSQVNRSGAQDNVIEGDKAAGSYDKLMTSDFCMSLSRKKEDKTSHSGRFHLMKNRYGMDGITYHVSANTSNGHFKIISEYNGEDHQPKPTPQNTSFSNSNVGNNEKTLLLEKFQEINP